MKKVPYERVLSATRHYFTYHARPSSFPRVGEVVCKQLGIDSNIQVRAAIWELQRMGEVVIHSDMTAQSRKHHDLFEHLKRAKDEIAKWPEWKRKFCELYMSQPLSDPDEGMPSFVTDPTPSHIEYKPVGSISFKLRDAKPSKSFQNLVEKYLMPNLHMPGVEPALNVKVGDQVTWEYEGKHFVQTVESFKGNNIFTGTAIIHADSGLVAWADSEELRIYDYAASSYAQPFTAKTHRDILLAAVSQIGDEYARSCLELMIGDAAEAGDVDVSFVDDLDGAPLRDELVKRVHIIADLRRHRDALIEAMSNGTSPLTWRPCRGEILALVHGYDQYMNHPENRPVIEFKLEGGRPVIMKPIPDSP